LKALSIANLKDTFGVLPLMPLLVKERVGQKEEGVTVKGRKIFEGPP